jgi:hypothetical protein
MGRGVVQYDRAVDGREKSICRCLVRGNNCLGVGGPYCRCALPRVDPIDDFAAMIVSVLRVQSSSVAGLMRASSFCSASSPRTSQPASSMQHGLRKCCGCRAVEQDSLGRPANSRTTQLRVLDDIARHPRVRLAIDINVAVAFEMTDDGHSRLLLNTRDETLAPRGTTTSM